MTYGRVDDFNLQDNYKKNARIQKESDGDFYLINPNGRHKIEAGIVDPPQLIPRCWIVENQNMPTYLKSDIVSQYDVTKKGKFFDILPQMQYGDTALFLGGVYDFSEIELDEEVIPEIYVNGIRIVMINSYVILPRQGLKISSERISIKGFGNTKLVRSESALVSLTMNDLAITKDVKDIVIEGVEFSIGGALGGGSFVDVKAINCLIKDCRVSQNSLIESSIYYRIFNLNTDNSDNGIEYNHKLINIFSKGINCHTIQVQTSGSSGSKHNVIVKNCFFENGMYIPEANVPYFFLIQDAYGDLVEYNLVVEDCKTNSRIVIKYGGLLIKNICQTIAYDLNSRSSFPSAVYKTKQNGLIENICSTPVFIDINHTRYSVANENKFVYCRNNFELGSAVSNIEPSISIIANNFTTP